VTMNKEHPLRPFLEPKSVALIGVSQKTGRGSFNILESLLKYGYGGEIYLVNPNAGDVLGLKAFKDVKALPRGIDLALIATRRNAVPEIVKRCADRDIRGVIIIAEGFSESDQEGKRLQRKINDVVSDRDIRVIGPNSIGVVNSFGAFSSSFLPLPKSSVPVALISQTGGFFEGFPGCPFGKGIDLGNMSDINFVDALTYFEKDEEIKIIAMYMETITDVPGFMAVCRRVLKSKPIIIIRGGRSELGRRASASHTGSLGGSDELFKAMFRQTGIIHVESVNDFGDIVKAFLYLPPFTGNRVAIITPTGGGGIIALDNVEDYGFCPASLSEESINTITPLFQPWANVGNPIDMLAAGMAHGYKYVYHRILESCLRDTGVDLVLAVCGTYTIKTIKEVAARYPDKPVAVWVTGSNRTSIEGKAEEYDFRPYYLSPDRALNALKAVREYHTLRGTGIKTTYGLS